MKGGISSPLIIHYPKLIRKQRINHEMAHIMEIMPTCLDLAATAYPKTYAGNTIRSMRGKSLFPLLMNKEKEAHEWLFWEHQTRSDQPNLSVTVPLLISESLFLMRNIPASS